MATDGLTTSGYIPNTAGEWFDFAKAEFDALCAELGITPPNYQRHEFVTAMLRIAAQMASEIDDAAGALFDLHDPAQASGSVLETLANITGTPFDVGSRSRVTLTVGAWARGNVTLPIGTEASDGTYIWKTIEDVTIVAGGTEDVVAEVEIDGAIAAPAGTITQRVTSVAGWTSVTNAADATIGTIAESDAIIRERISRGSGSKGSRSPSAVRSALLKVPGVQEAIVVFNATDAAVTVSARSIPKYGCGVWVYPDDLTDNAKKAVLGILYAMLPSNVTRSLPTATGATGIRGAIEGSDGRTHYEGAWYMTETPIRIRVTLSDASSYEGSGSWDTVRGEIEEVVEAYFAGLGPGDAFRQNDLVGRIAGVAGVARSTVESAVSPYAAYSSNDRTIDQASFATLESVVFVQTA